MKPIIMSTEDVLALLDGRKTMTRRVIKFPGDYLVHRYDGPEDNGMHLFAWGHVMPTLHVQLMGEKQTDGVTFCDGYYEVKAPHRTGDVLWVRETWAKNTDYANPALYIPHGFIHKATGEYHMGVKWRSPVAMPREAARLFLRVTDVRVERVQDITDEGSIKEGCTGVICDHPKWDYVFGCADCMNSGWREPPRLEFSQRWDARNAKHGYGHGWDSNPFAWVISFERLE